MDTRGILHTALISWALLIGYSSGCSRPGWFGSRCQYQCRCTNNNCDSDGQCKNGAGCVNGWFGPACQYVDLAYYGTASDYVLKDGNDSSCIQQTNLTRTTFTLNDSYTFTWLRVCANTPDFFQNLTLTFNNNLSCINPRNSSVDDTTLDIYCDQNEAVQNVTLTGNGVQYLCSVYVNGGRNVALRRNTSQSSTYREPPVNFTSDLAVDGNTNGDFNAGMSCSSTTPENSKLYWNITFSVPQTIQRYTIYNRVDNYLQSRLQGFVLESFDADSRMVFNHTDSESPAQDVYHITSRGSITSSFSLVSVQRPTGILTLCEVQIFGDSVCDSGYYGRECEHTCNCAVNESCFVSTGGCPSGCAVGFQGENCNNTCTYNKWGEGCNSECSPNCVPPGDQSTSPCDNVNGTCQLGCTRGYTGLLCTEGPSEDDKSLIIGAVVGSVLGAIVVIAVIIGVVFCVRKYKNKKSEAVPDHPVEFSTESNFNKKPSTKNPPAGKKQDTAAGNITHGVYYNSIGNVSPPSTVVSLDELEGYMASRSSEFFKDQFSAIPSNEQATMTAGMSSENKTKNRYKNVCAYDHSRVHLIPNSGKKQGDYINASYIEGYKPDEKFIASQGPTKIILEDFVRMLWEQKVEKVVMLTNLVEEGKQKCERYWPEDNEMRVGEITIKLSTTKVFADHTIRILQLRKEGKPPQDLTHYHFTSWPDKDIPTAPWGLVDFEQRVAAHSTSRPIVVHCSAGIGRTGTFIALRNVMRQAEETGSMDFFKTVQKLRHDRINMVQTAEQYIFLHKAAQVAMLCIGTTVTSVDIQNRIKTLQTKTQTGETRIEKEFKAICSACDEREEEKSEENPYSVYENSQSLLNREKNRLSNILAKEMYRAILMNENSDVEDYINAVLVPSFTKQNQQILTQLPLPTTVTDFWRLVTQYKVALIVAFQVDLKTTDQTIGNYLPTDENQPLTSSMFEIRTEPKTVSKFWIQQKLAVAVDTEKMSKVTAVKIKNTIFEQIDKEHHVTHLTCTTTDLDPRAMLTITEYVRSLKPAGDRRILYMCRNGANYSGMLCVLHLLLDRMDNDGCLTVPLVVGAMKAIRPQVIPTLDQYKHLYEALQLYTQSTNVYSNFGSSRT